MKKEPKSMNWRGLIGTGIKVVFVAEALAFLGTYACWSKLNTSRDFRHKMYNYCPPILESYYWIGETFGDLPMRKMDYEAWGVAKEK